MTTKQKAAIVVCGILAGGIATAQFIAPLPVTDVSAVPAWATKLANDITLIEKGVATVLGIERMIKNMEYQAQYLQNIGSRWAWITHPWTPAYFNDSTGLNSGWLGAINSDLNTINAYSRIVQTLDNDLLFNPGALPMDSQRAIAMIERMDGHVTQSTSIVGQYSIANTDHQIRQGRLAASMYSQNPDDLTAAAQAQKTNSALMLIIENTNLQGELSRKALEQQTENMILERERLAGEMNSDAYFNAHAADLITGGAQTQATISTQ